MRLYILSLITCGVLHGSVCGSGYSDCYLITWTNSTALMGTADVANYAGYLRGSDVPGKALATVANGGKVQHTATQSGGGASIAVPADAILATDFNCNIKVAGWEFETYSAVTGDANIHTNIGTLTHTTNASTVLCVGKSSVTTWQGNIPATWDSSYVAVLHSPNGSTLDLHDSTSNAVNGTNNLVSATTGIVDGGVNINGSFSAVTGSDSIFPTGQTITVSFWFATTSPDALMFTYGAGNSQNATCLIDNSGRASFITGVPSVHGSTSSIDGLWHYVVGTTDASKNLNIYVDGIQGTTANDPSLSLTRTGSWFFGTPDGSFQGSFDELRVSSIARSSSILAEYNNFSNPSSFYTIVDLNAGPLHLRGTSKSRGSVIFR